MPYADSDDSDVLPPPLQSPGGSDSEEDGSADPGYVLYPGAWFAYTAYIDRLNSTTTNTEGRSTVTDSDNDGQYAD